jgi:hypothetical protein
MNFRSRKSRALAISDVFVLCGYFGRSFVAGKRDRLCAVLEQYKADKLPLTYLSSNQPLPGDSTLDSAPISFPPLRWVGLS